MIASGHAFDYRKIARPPATAILVFFHDHLREFTNRLSRRKIKKGGMEAWNISHLMSDLVTQDVLILASRDDHFIPFRLHQEQLRRLTAARSVTSRVFSREDHAQNHCQIGTIGLALRVMREWIDGRA